MTVELPSGPQVLEAILLPGVQRNPNRLAGRVALYDASGNPIDLASGSQGPKGDTGPAGPAGPQGPKGDQGVAGSQGAAGAAGPKGDTGAAGAVGPTGPAGAQGAKGDPGPQGAVGATGATGAPGAAGTQGPAGAAGPKGDPGSQGIQGVKGDKGDKGDRGDTGPQGSVGATGATGAQGPVGPEGPQGPVGNIPIVTTLPASPTDGQEVYYQIGSDGFWHLRYSALIASGDGYGWCFLGGPSLHDDVLGVQTSSSTTPVDLGGPNLTLPLPGIYNVGIGGRGGSSAASAILGFSYMIDAAAAVGTDGFDLRTASASAGRFYMARTKRKTFPLASVLSSRYWTAGSNTIEVSERWMDALPVRVKKA